MHYEKTIKTEVAVTVRSAQPIGDINRAVQGAIVRRCRDLDLPGQTNIDFASIGVEKREPAKPTTVPIVQCVWCRQSRKKAHALITFGGVSVCSDCIMNANETLMRGGSWQGPTF